MTFQPLANYQGFNHVPVAGAVWIHPGNGNAYCCACEKDSGKRQDLTVYRLVRGAAAWEMVKRYEGTSAESVAQITMGGAGIDQDGNLLVVTSLILPNVPRVTYEGFQGCWIRETGIDEPWGTDSAVEARIAALESRIAALTAGAPALVSPLQLPAQLPPHEGAEIQMADGAGGPPWCIDVYRGALRLHRGGVVVMEWKAPTV